MRKIIFTFGMLLLSCMFFVPCFSAEPEVLYWGDYGYCIDEGGTVEIYRWYGQSETVVIPGEIEGRKVTKIRYQAFYGRHDVTSIEIPSSVTVIENEAFCGCTSLVNINIPSSVTWILDGAFTDCSSMTRIEIPSSVQIIGSKVFLGCDNLAGIIVSPENDYYKDINGVLFNKQGNYLDCYPSGLSGSEYYIPDGTITISGYAFAGCKNLMKIEIPSSVTTIKDRAFIGCQNLMSINIPESVTSIGVNPFIDCKNLMNVAVSPENEQYVFIENAIINRQENSLICYVGGASAGVYTIPDGIIQISEEAFLNSDITSVIVPPSVTTIGERSFKDSNSLTSIELPSSVTTIEQEAFSGCTSLTNLNIPVSLTTIEKNTFSHCSGLTQVVIPSSVTTIEYSAFYDCNNLASIIIPSSVTTIDRVAFLTYGDLTLTVDPGSFALQYAEVNGIPYIINTNNIDDTGIQNIDTAEMSQETLWDVLSEPETTEVSSIDSVESDQESMWDIISEEQDNPSADSEVVPSNMYEYVLLADGTAEITFYHGKGEEQLIIPDTLDGHMVTSIHSFAFSSDKSVKKLILPKNLRKIGEGAFDYCENLITVALPEGLTSVEDFAFAGCKSLESINLPTSIISMGANPFKGCYNVCFDLSPEHLYLVMEAGVLFSKSDGRLIYYPNNMEEYAVPYGTRIIGNAAFAECDKLRSIMLPKGLLSIEYDAFNNCTNLININLPDGLMKIEDNAFLWCNSLSGITIPSSVTSIGGTAFRGPGDNLIFIVTKGSYGERYCSNQGIRYEFADF